MARRSSNIVPGLGNTLGGQRRTLQKQLPPTNDVINDLVARTNAPMRAAAPPVRMMGNGLLDMVKRPPSSREVLEKRAKERNNIRLV